jgi:hypothetical protein
MQASRIRARAERRLGEILKAMAEKGERKGGRGGDRKSSSAARLDLESLKIPKDRASRAMQLADVPQSMSRRSAKPTASKRGPCDGVGSWRSRLSRRMAEIENQTVGTHPLIPEKRQENQPAFPTISSSKPSASPTCQTKTLSARSRATDRRR